MKLNNLECKIAYSISERLGAFSLISEAYTAAGLDNLSETNLRITPYHLLSSTIVFIAKLDGHIVMTVSLIQDSHLGLPMDSIYSEELEARRNSGMKLAEVGCLAARKDLRNSVDIFIELGKLLVQFALYRGLDALVIAVHPKHKRFYEKIFAFRQFGLVKTYPTVENKPAVGMELNFKIMHRTRQKLYQYMIEDKLPTEKFQIPNISASEKQLLKELVDDNFKFLLV